MNKIIIVDKEKNMTSHDVVNKIRKIFKTKRVGHTGTLDPNATGVLVVCLNEATKLVQFLESDQKTYLARVCIGISTDTEDSEGTIIDKKEIQTLSEELVDSTLRSFLGEGLQFPPMFSAIKKDGKKLYEYARKGETVVVEPRRINILDIHRISPLNYNNENQTFEFDFITTVSKGTYIRTLCVDIGKNLGYPAHMKELRRIKVGSFDLIDARKISEIETGNYKSFDMLESLKMYKAIDDEEFIIKANNGMKISINKVVEKLGKQEKRIIIKDEDKLIAIYELDLEKKCYKAARVWKY